MSLGIPAAPEQGSIVKTQDQLTAEALALMERALALIDVGAGPDDVGAHLDLAIHRLKDWIEKRPE